MLNFFRKKKKPQNLKQVLAYLNDLEKKNEVLAKELRALKEEDRFCIQRVGLVRFNPFSSVGSDQSFSIALLDGSNTGIVITSLFSREGNRVYAKPLEKGISKYSLSEEEKEAIRKAAGK